MKFVVLALVAAFSLSASAMEFRAKLDRVFCTINNGNVVRTQFLNKARTVSFTETKTVLVEGVESVLAKVLETAPTTPANMEQDYVFTLIHEGTTYVLNADASPDTQILVRLVAQSCR
jgi:hypothetical protein